MVVTSPSLSRKPCVVPALSTYRPTTAPSALMPPAQVVVDAGTSKETQVCALATVANEKAIAKIIVLIRLRCIFFLLETSCAVYWIGMLTDDPAIKAAVN